MTNDAILTISTPQRIAAWLVHLFTASGAILGLLALYAIHNENFWLSFWFMGAAIFVDGVDGTFARLTNTKVAAAKIDGALLDNILDYFNYVMVPAFLLIVHPTIVTGVWGIIVASLIALTSAYQFSQSDAKTDDHYFKGFPSYWNIIVFYLYFWEFSSGFNLFILLFLIIMIFVPIKYIYPSRLDYLTTHHSLRLLMLFGSVLWALSAMGLLLTHPNDIWTLSAMYDPLIPIFVFITFGYTLLYIIISLYRTFVPLSMD
ncbi:CDP-alcohol phosphatidyltransferase family protein [Anaerolineales bacterium HSG25]|nr:CDP-alcohol phosphatidyltransferase family protein [Anaerolineales bacterium HSG25]